jgi:hypothetical protein
VEGLDLPHPLALEISMSGLQCYDAFMKKAANDIGMQDKWIAHEDWDHYIRNQDGLKYCNVSHMNCSISSKCQFTNNRFYVSHENSTNSLEQQEDYCYCKVK